MYERMLEKQMKPTIDDMCIYCGANGERFTQLNHWLAENYETEQKLSFPYGNNYGWAVAHRKKNKLICNIFAEDGAFTVMLRLTDKQYESLYSLVGKYTQDYIDHKYPCGDGGWIHYRVTCAEHLDDVQTLLAAKCA